MKYVLLFLFIPVMALSQNHDLCLNHGAINQKEYFEEIPFTFLKGQIIVNVSIDEKNYRFSLDTGGPTSISDELYAKFNFPVIKKIEAADANNEKDSVKVISLKSLSLGNIEIKNAAALVVNSSNLIYKCLGIDGNLGSNSLRNSVVQFSSPEKTIKITNDVKKLNLKRKDSKKLKLTTVQSSPVFWIDLIGRDKGRLQVLFDSGMEGLLDISLRSFADFNEYNIFHNIKSANGNGSASLFEVPNDTLHYKMSVDKMKFGKLELQNVISTTTKAENSRVGTKILEYAVVTLDYNGKRIYFSPIDNYVKDAYEPTFPIQPTYKNGKLQIGFIWNNEKYPNICLGDEILSIDGVSCKERTICELLLMNDLNGKERTITTRGRDGKEITTIITKE